jgi:ankyrin repeat protein
VKIAAENGHYEMVSVLIGQGANINIADNIGWTSLHYAW